MLPETGKFFPKPFYFPVKEGPYRLRSALDQWPEPGYMPQNNPQDGRFFQIDDELAETQAAKLATFHQPQIILEDSTRALHEEVLCWMARTLTEEYHPATAEPGIKTELEWYKTWGDQIGEDVVVLQRTAPGRDRVVMEDVRFPSGWNPYQIIGQSFQLVHHDVPDFAQCDKRAKAFVDAIVERGPWQRFVWMLATMPDLNVHEFIERPPWPTALRCLGPITKRLRRRSVGGWIRWPRRCRPGTRSPSCRGSIATASRARFGCRRIRCESSRRPRR